MYELPRMIPEVKMLLALAPHLKLQILRRNQTSFQGTHFCADGLNTFKRSMFALT